MLQMQNLKYIYISSIVDTELKHFGLNTSRIKCGGISLSCLFCISNTVETIGRFNLFVMFGRFFLTGLTGFYIGGVIVF